MTGINQNIGAVVIGRNEGQRLAVCLESLLKHLDVVVYVDSGSTDESLNTARTIGAKIVELDLSIPFTAARARNAGFELLAQQYPELEYVQFVDGDCELVPEWLNKACSFLDQHSDYAVVCGRRRERYPQASIYNLLCDIEWDTPIGDAKSCGGDALMRADALRSMKGYRETLIAGEEPELCYRMRQADWKIFRLDSEMTLHNAAMTQLSQWWKRAKRAGHAYAEGYALHGHKQEPFRRSDVMRIAFWAGGVPFLILMLSLLSSIFLGLFGVYGLQVARLTLNYRQKLGSNKTAFWYAMSNVFGRFAQASGMIKYFLTRVRGQKATLIEYK